MRSYFNENIMLKYFQKIHVLKNAIPFLNHGMRFRNDNNILCMHTDISCNTVILIDHINWYDSKITHTVL